LFRVVTKWKYLVQCARTAFSAVRIVQCCNEVEQCCSVRTDSVQRGSHCSVSLRSGTSLLRSYGLRSARFKLFGVVTKWNYLVQCARTAFNTFALFSVVTKQNYLVQCARTAFNAVRIFSVVTKWNYLVPCARTAFSAVRIVRCRNEVEQSCSVRTDIVQHGSHCLVS